jgi:putative oxidoreductase
MKSFVRNFPHSPDASVIPIQPRIDARRNGALALLLFRLDELILDILRRWSITVLRLALGLVFFWFGALKLFGNSPVVLLIQETYKFLPVHAFVLFLGGWEILIGLGIVLKRALRCVLVLLCVHLLGTFVALVLNPHVFFIQGLPLFLTSDGEFVMKNLVLIGAGLVIAGYEVKPLARASVNSNFAEGGQSCPPTFPFVSR